MTYPIHSYSSTLYFLMPGSIFSSLCFKTFLFTLTYFSQLIHAYSYSYYFYTF